MYEIDRVYGIAFMNFPVDIWLRGTDFATTATIDTTSAPAAWTDDDVRGVLEGMLRVMNHSKNPGADSTIALRGLSWIVNPYEEGGVVIAIEITLGAVVAGPFEIEKTALEAMIERVLTRPIPPAASTRVH